MSGSYCLKYFFLFIFNVNFIVNYFISFHHNSQASLARDSLAKALYCRTVATIVRRANSLKRIGSTCGTLSSDSNESMHNNTETSSHHASTIGKGSSEIIHNQNFSP